MEGTVFLACVTAGWCGLIHGYNWNGLNRGDECGFIYSWTGEKV